MPKEPIDWISEMNKLADEHKLDDRLIVEEMIMYLDSAGHGPRFLKFLQSRAKNGFQTL